MAGGTGPGHTAHAMPYRAPTATNQNCPAKKTDAIPDRVAMFFAPCCSRRCSGIERPGLLTVKNIPRLRQIDRAWPAGSGWCVYEPPETIAGCGPVYSRSAKELG